MLKLDNNDKKGLLDIITSLPILATERGREAVFIGAGLEEIRHLIDLSGPSAIVIPIIINELSAYGRLSYEHEALGRFLNALKSYSGIDDQKFLDFIITKYNLMIPASGALTKLDWKIAVSAKEINEKIIGENTLRPISFLKQGLKASSSVAYIEVNSNGTKWSGTGFLISPRLLITNNHVLPQKNLALNTVFRFNYQLNMEGNPEIANDYFARKEGIFHTNSALDYTIVELDEEPGTKWDHLVLKPSVPELESRVNIIQHPNGLPKQISIQNNFVKYVDDIKIQYITSTLPGSSGSPVFNDNWEVIGLHHSGGWLPEKEDSPFYFRNEGILIKAILYDLPIEIKDSMGITLDEITHPVAK